MPYLPSYLSVFPISNRSFVDISRRERLWTSTYTHVKCVYRKFPFLSMWFHGIWSIFAFATRCVHHRVRSWRTCHGLSPAKLANTLIENRQGKCRSSWTPRFDIWLNLLVISARKFHWFLVWHLRIAIQFIYGIFTINGWEILRNIYILMKLENILTKIRH